MIIDRDYRQYLQHNYNGCLGNTKTPIKYKGCGLATLCAYIYTVTGKAVDLPTINYLLYLHGGFVNWAGQIDKPNSDLILWKKLEKIFPNIKLEDQILYWQDVENKSKYIRENSIISVESKPDVSHFLVILEMKNNRIKTVFDSLNTKNNGITNFNYWRKFPYDSDSDTVRSIINYKLNERSQKNG